MRAHVKAIFARAGVSSRGEPTAKLFAEFYEPAHAAERSSAPTPSQGDGNGARRRLSPGRDAQDAGHGARHPT